MSKARRYIRRIPMVNLGDISNGIWYEIIETVDWQISDLINVSLLDELLIQVTEDVERRYE